MTSPAPVTAASPTIVVWDVGRVLVEWDLGLLYHEAIPDPQERARFVAEVVSEEWHGQHDAGVPWAQMVPARAAQFPESAALIERYATHWLDSVPGPVAGTHDLIRRLAARDVPQYAITNFGVDAWALFRPTFPILDHCRDIVVSGAERMVKPDPAIFELAAGRFGHAPASMLFIDDNAANIATARELGWHSHHFTRGAAALEADLIAHGLLDQA